LNHYLIIRKAEHFIRKEKLSIHNCIHSASMWWWLITAAYPLSNWEAQPPRETCQHCIWTQWCTCNQNFGWGKSEPWILPWNLFTVTC